ncbi:hypothetical protein BDV95DRAFT_563295 [Massariosphaeria phaeospora]|uniref:Uncharacterized protein n=1 Tax=Massariosphaeria phaeospora TaxID=100035 RepID=A0A7C8IM82_9PLEO|nr:hypothetical protein BDV95DRAFT_563295 [Massariosphaeria phaeospora]
MRGYYPSAREVCRVRWQERNHRQFFDTPSRKTSDYLSSKRLYTCIKSRGSRHPVSINLITC